MKLSVGLISIVALTASIANAADVLNCRAGDELSSRSLRVYESAAESGYSFELCQTHRFAHELPCPSGTGDVSRSGLTFHNQDVRIIHLFGQYAFMDQRDGTDIRFPDEGCVIDRDVSSLQPVALLVAGSEIINCESNDGGVSAKLQFRPSSAGRYEGLKMEFQGKSVLADPLSVFNHMGLILFRGTGGIEFRTSEYDNHFEVTVPSSGSERVVVATGICSGGL